MERLKVPKKLIHKNIGVDSSVLIYLFNNEPKKSKKIAEILSLSKKITASSILHLEIATGFYKKDQFSLIDVLNNLPRICKNFEYINADIKICSIAGYLRSKYQFLKTPDAIHIATAILTKADYFLTSDRKLQKVREIRVESI
jgi:predicted nucleic acid-binding protein